MRFVQYLVSALLVMSLFCTAALADGTPIFQTGKLPAVSSTLKVREGEKAPDFSLPSITGETVSLSDYKGMKTVIISFVPAAFTPICSKQWPGYNLVEQHLKEKDAIVLGITTDNVPSLFAWTKHMGGVWFPVLSDFYPHGKVAERYGVLRPEGTAERATFVIDKQGIIRKAWVHDINAKPELQPLFKALESLE